MSYEKLSAQEREWRQRVAELVEEASRRGVESPEPVRTAAGLLKRILAAKRELEREAREKAERVRQER